MKTLLKAPAMELRRSKGTFITPTFSHKVVEGVCVPARPPETLARRARLAQMHRAIKKVADQNDSRTPEQFRQAYQDMDFVEV